MSESGIEAVYRRSSLITETCVADASTSTPSRIDDTITEPAPRGAASSSTSSARNAVSSSERGDANPVTSITGTSPARRILMLERYNALRQPEVSCRPDP